MSVFFSLLYNAFLIVGTVYLIVEYDWSPWWFLMTILFMVSVIKKNDKEVKEDNDGK